MFIWLYLNKGLHVKFGSYRAVLKLVSSVGQATKKSHICKNKKVLFSAAISHRSLLFVKIYVLFE